MDLLTPLKRPINGLKGLRDFNPGIPDLAGLLTDAKPVLYTDCGGGDLPYIKLLCEKLKLVYMFPEAGGPRAGFHSRMFGRSRMLLISKSRARLKEAADGWNRSNLSEQWGMALGYPPCCVKSYIKWKKKFSAREDLVRFIAGRTAGTGPFPFGLNNIFNYFSRLTPDVPGDLKRHKDIIDLNRACGISTLHVISWHPCSYRCAASARKADRIFAFIAHYLPQRALTLRRALANPVLFLDKYEFLAMAGRLRETGLFYKGILPPRSLVKKSLFRKVLSGDRLSACGGRLRIFSGNGLLSEVKTSEKPLFLDFSAMNRRP